MNKSELLRIWSEVRRKHFYPELPDPVSVESLRFEARPEPDVDSIQKQSEGSSDIGDSDQSPPPVSDVALEIKSKRISLSESFVKQLTDFLPPEKTVEALLDHGVSHYSYCPWNFFTHLSLYNEAKAVMGDKEMAQRVAEYFMDVAADTHCFKTMETPLPELYRAMNRAMTLRDQSDQRTQGDGITEQISESDAHQGKIHRAIHALYQRIWGEDLGIQGFEKISRKLSRIPYLDRKRWPESIRRFAKIVKALLESEEQTEGSGESNPMGENDLSQYSNREVDQGLREFALTSGSPSEFKNVVEDFQEELDELGYPDYSGMGLGQGSSVDADLLYYMKLAENYSLPVRKTPIEKSGSMYPYSHSPWEVGKPFKDIDPWTSFGKYMPGITQIWERREGETYGEDEATPDCIVMIDSSGSMVNPKQYLSHAVLGAACASDAYLRNDASVAVYNFSDVEAGGRRVLDFTNDRKSIYQCLCHYFGGGTRIDIGDIDAIKSDGTPDIFMITDMQITNLESLIEYFNGLDNRITAVHIGDNEHVRKFRRSMEIRKNLNIYTIQKKEDIPRIVLGKVREYLGNV